MRCLTALLETLLISGLALVLVRSTFLDPLKRTAKWLRTLRAGETQIPASLPQGEIFDQLNAEMTHLARDLGAARAAARRGKRNCGRDARFDMDGGTFTHQLAKQIKRKTAFRGFQP